MGSPPAADTRPDVLQQTRAVQGAGAALPRCLGPRSADLQRPCRVGSKSGREGRRGAAAQHTHYGAVHRDTGKPRAMRSSSDSLPDFRKGKLARIFRPKNIYV
jgi:hypothetical protein